MSVITIRKAKREGARLVIGLCGISGSGKTYTAIKLAYGLANFNPEKVGFIDTENRRGSLYSDILRDDPTTPTNGEFWIGDLDAPFSPQRYIDAIKEFEKAGVEVLVIDSISHEWEGTGGCEEIAHAGNPKNPKWNDAKREHKRFMNALLQSNMHVIVCIRAREKVKLVRDAQGKTQYEPQGILPVTEKNVLFEMTASLMMWNDGSAQDVLKCPSDLVRILGRGEGYITSADGKALRDWVDGAKQLDPKVEQWRNRLRNNTEQGEAHIVDCWAKVPEPIQQALGDDFRVALISAAKSFDEQRQLENQGDGKIVDDLNSQLLGSEAAE
jgi:hypothetical protein